MTFARLADLMMCGVLAAVGACGGGSDGPSVCDDFELTACGGDPVGVWSSSAFCPTGSTVEVDYASSYYPDCSSANVSRETHRMDSVAITINADGTYTSEATTSTTFDITIDRACGAIIAAQEMPGASLEQLCDYLRTQYSQYAATSCAVSGDQCHCRVTSSDVDSDSGTYTVDTTTGTLTLGWYTTEYCVEGNQLSLRWSDTLPDQPATYVILNE